MAKYEKTIIGKFEEVPNRLENDISNSAMTMNLVDECNYTFEDTLVDRTRVRITGTAVNNGNKDAEEAEVFVRAGGKTVGYLALGSLDVDEEKTFTFNDLLL